MSIDRDQPPPQLLDSLPGITVIVPVYRGGPLFQECLDCLARLEPPPLETLIVVDGPDAESARRGAAAGFRTIQLPERAGPAAARNAGAAQARGEILFFADADVAVPPDAIGRLRRFFDEDPGLAALIGSYDLQPPAPNFLSQFKNLQQYYVHQGGRREAGTFWGACGAIRQEALAAVGGFGTAYGKPSIADIELGVRLCRAGFRIHLQNDFQVTHLKRWTPRSLLRSEVLRRAIPWTRLILREGRLPNDLNLAWTGRWSVILTFLGLGFAAAALFWPACLFGLGAAGAALRLINAPFYRFLLRRRGAWLTVRAIIWHCFYHFYSGASFLVGISLHLLSRPAPEGAGRGQTLAAEEPLRERQP